MYQDKVGQRLGVGDAVVYASFDMTTDEPVLELATVTGLRGGLLAMAVAGTDTSDVVEPADVVKLEGAQLAFAKGNQRSE